MLNILCCICYNVYVRLGCSPYLQHIIWNIVFLFIHIYYFRLTIDLIMVFLYASAMAVIAYLGVKIYRAGKKGMPLVAKASKKYILAIVLLNSSQLFLRMIFLSVSDIDNLKINSESTGEGKWEGVLFGMGFSEIFTSVCIIISINLIHKIENIANAYYI